MDTIGFVYPINEWLECKKYPFYVIRHFSNTDDTWFKEPGTGLKRMSLFKFLTL